MFHDLTHDLTHCQNLELYSRFGSVLTKTEGWLGEHPSFVRRLRNRPRMRFRSEVDAVLCTALPEYVAPCRAYYRGKGPALEESLTEEELEELDVQLLGACVASFEAIRVKTAAPKRRYSVTKEGARELRKL